MSVILIMLPAALVLAAIAVGAFIWAAKRGQFDDLDTPPVRAVFDDEAAADPVGRRASVPRGAPPADKPEDTGREAAGRE